MPKKNTEIVESQAVSSINAEQLLTQAIDKGVPVETMEKLLAMRRELKAEWAKEEFDKAMAAFQAECPIIEKKQSAGMYKYATLDAIVSQTKDLISKHGFSYTFDMRKNEQTITVICHVRHKHGHSQTNQFEVSLDAGSMNKPQKDGSTSSYGKRYAFCNAFGILTGDEDNDAATPKPNPSRFAEQKKYPNKEQLSNGKTIDAETGEIKQRYKATQKGLGALSRINELLENHEIEPDDRQAIVLTLGHVKSKYDITDEGAEILLEVITDMTQQDLLNLASDISIEQSLKELPRQQGRE